MNEQANEVIKQELILLQQEYQTKEEALLALIQQADECGVISSQRPFLEAVLSREAEVSTAIGYQIAIPHGKSAVVETPFIGLLQAKTEFIWSKADEEAVKLVFLIGVPLENPNNIHLKFISQLSKKLLDDEFRQKLLDVTDEKQAYELLRMI